VTLSGVFGRGETVGPITGRAPGRVRSQQIGLKTRVTKQRIVGLTLRDLYQIGRARRIDKVIVTHADENADRAAACFGHLIRRPVQAIDRAVIGKGRVVDVPVIDPETVGALKRRRRNFRGLRRMYSLTLLNIERY